MTIRSDDVMCKQNQEQTNRTPPYKVLKKRKETRNNTLEWLLHVRLGIHKFVKKPLRVPIILPASALRKTPQYGVVVHGLDEPQPVAHRGSGGTREQCVVQEW